MPRASLRCARYSIKAEAASAAKPLGLDPSRLSITKTSHPKALSKPETLVFGREFTGKFLLPFQDQADH